MELYTQRGAVAGAFFAGEMVAGQAGDQVEVPATLLLEDDDHEERYDEEERAWQHGSVVEGHEVEARDVTLSGTVWLADAAAARTWAREWKAAARRRDQFLSVDDDHYIKLARLRRMQVSPETLSGRALLRVRSVWRAADPFWYSAAGSTLTVELAGDDTIEVDAGELATVPMDPVITVAAPAGESVPSVSLVNNTDDGQGWLYTDLGLTDEAAVVVDSAAGTVALDGDAGAIRYLSGGWLRLLPGVNVLSYEGAACTLTITWRERWI